MMFCKLRVLEVSCSMWWSRYPFCVCLKTSQKIEGADSWLSLGQKAGGAEQSFCSTKVGMLPCVVCPEPAKIICPSSKLPGNNGTDTWVPARSQRELGLGLARSPADDSDLRKGSKRAWPYKKAAVLQLCGAFLHPGFQQIHWPQGSQGLDYNWKLKGLQLKEFRLTDRGDVAGSKGWWSYFSVFFCFLFPFFFSSSTSCLLWK